MHMKKWVGIAVGALFFISCSRDEGKIAANAAKVYYEQLLEGKYADFVDGTFHGGPIPDTLRNQLILNAEMFVEQQQKEHAGILRVEVGHFQADSLGTSAQAFLIFHYGDSTSEQVVVPMIKHGRLWLMR